MNTKMGREITPGPKYTRPTILLGRRNQQQSPALAGPEEMALNQVGSLTCDTDNRSHQLCHRVPEAAVNQTAWQRHRQTQIVCPGDGERIVDLQYRGIGDGRRQVAEREGYGGINKV